MSKHANGSHPECRIVCADSRIELELWKDQGDLIVTSPQYADARRNHYESIHPDQFKDWFLTFHQAFYDALKPEGSLVIHIKDKIVDGVRHRYVWQTIEALCERGWHAIDDYVWHKPNAMPGYWLTRLRDGWEYCFHLAKNKRPYVNQDAVRIPVGDCVASRLAKLGKNDLSRHNSANKSGFGRESRRVACARLEKEAAALPSEIQLCTHGSYAEKFTKQIPQDTAEQIRFFEKPSAYKSRVRKQH